MTSSHRSSMVGRAAGGLTVAVAISCWGIWPGPVLAQERSSKQAWLEATPRAADAPEILRTRSRRPSDAPPLPYMRGHIVVKFAEAVTPQAMRALAAEIGARQVRALHHADFVYIEIPPDADPLAAAAAMAGKPGVLYAEPDARVLPMLRPNDPLYRYQWNLQKTDMERAWDINPGGKRSIIVAVVDSGVAYADKGVFVQAPELTGVPFVSPWDFVWDDAEPFDMDGHGTHLTGTIAQVTNNSEGVAGIAFNVSIMPLKALYADWDEALGAPFPFGASTVARAVRYAADNGAQVINLSLGSLLPNTATRDALEYAIGKGAFIAIAAGNEGTIGNPPLYPAVYAKDLDGAMAVGAVDYDLKRAPYSNVNDYLEIAAPGGDVDQDANDDEYGDGILQQTLDFDAVESGVFDRFAYYFLDGTSMATAHVSGMAALLMDQGITSPAAVEAIIKASATDTGTPGRDNETGYGLINPRAAIRGLGLRR